MFEHLLTAERIGDQQQITNSRDASEPIDPCILVLKNTENKGAEFDPAADILSNSIDGENGKL